MKLAIAFGILVQSLPIVSEKTNDVVLPEQKIDLASILSSIHRNSVNSMETTIDREAVMTYCDPSSEDPDVGILSCGPGKLCKPTSDDSNLLGGICEPKQGGTTGRAFRKSFRFGKRAALKNIREAAAVAVLNAEECDPTESPDTGILVCGQGQFCVPSVTSSIGGFCMSNTPSRRLVGEADFCDPSSELYTYYDCDCSSFDNITGTGEIMCTTLENYCLGSYYTGCDDVCTTQTLSHTLTNFTATSYQICDDLTTSDEKACIEVDYETNSCSVSLNDQMCASCMPVPNGYYNSQIFDCTNVGGLTGTSIYGFEFLPSVDACYTSQTFLCDVCKNGGVLDPDTIVSVEGLDFACSVFETSLNQTVCADTTPIVEATCCGTENVIPAPSPGSSPESESLSGAASMPSFLSRGLGVYYLGFTLAGALFCIMN